MMQFAPYINYKKEKIEPEKLRNAFDWYRKIILSALDEQYSTLYSLDDFVFKILKDDFIMLVNQLLKLEKISNKYESGQRADHYARYSLNEYNLEKLIDVLITPKYQEHIKELSSGGFANYEEQRHLLIVSYIYENYKTDFEKAFFSSGYPIADKQRAKGHTYILGGTGSGKSELMKFLLFKDFQHAKRSVIVLEPHGKLTKEVAHLKGKDHEKLVYVSFDDDFTGNGKTAVMNPFYLKERTKTAIKSRTDAIILAFGMIMKAEFTDNMDILLSSTIPIILGKENGSFWELQRFFDDSQNDDLVQLGQQSTNPALRQIFARYKELETFKGTKNALFLKLQKLLGDEKFANFTTGKTTIDIDEITAQGKWLLFNTRPKDIGEEGIEALGKFLISLIYSTVKQRNEDDPNNTPTFLYIDEFQNYVTETTKKILSESRKYKFFITLAHQTLGQDMSEQFQKEILSNTNVKIIGLNGIDQLMTIIKKLHETDIKEDFAKYVNKGNGHFYLTVTGEPSRPILVPKKLLGYSHAVSKEEWENIRAAQLKKYYTTIKAYEAPPQSKSNFETPKIKPQNGDFSDFNFNLTLDT